MRQITKPVYYVLFANSLCYFINFVTFRHAQRVHWLWMPLLLYLQLIVQQFHFVIQWVILLFG